MAASLWKVRGALFSRSLHCSFLYHILGENARGSFFQSAGYFWCPAAALPPSPRLAPGTCQLLRWLGATNAAMPAGGVGRPPTGVHIAQPVAVLPLTDAACPLRVLRARPAGIGMARHPRRRVRRPDAPSPIC